MVGSDELEEVVECDFEVSLRENNEEGESRLESRGVNSEGRPIDGR